MADVFISYSRRSNDFARRLIDKLNLLGKDSWIDWEGIPLTSPNWWMEIKTGIESADSFLFIMSTDSMASVVCNMELDYAFELRKRIIPVVHRDVVRREAFASIADFEPDEAMQERLAGKDPLIMARDNWQRLSHINWVFFRDTDDFDISFERLITTVETDLPYIRAHTRYLTRAQEWARENKPEDLLLFGSEIDRAEAWLAQGESFAAVAPDKDAKVEVVNPLPQELHRTYILASRAAAISRDQHLLDLQRAAGVEKIEHTNDVFLSYSHEDKHIMERLHKELNALDRDIWVDWQNIKPTVNWMSDIYSNIEKTATFVFIASPNSIRSLICNLEVAHAISLNKRLVPIIYQDINFDKTINEVKNIPFDTGVPTLQGKKDLKMLMEDNWKALKVLNWLHFRTDEEFTKNFSRLIDAIDTNLPYVNDHTRWLLNAIEWDKKSHNASFLLEGAQLREAESWLAKSKGEYPVPNKLHRAYILASRRKEIRRRIMLLSAILAFVFVLLLAAYWVFQAQSALDIASVRGTEAAKQALIAENNHETLSSVQVQFQILVAQTTATAEKDLQITITSNEPDIFTTIPTSTPN